VTCDAVLSESAFLSARRPNGLLRFSRILETGAIVSRFDSASNLAAIAVLLRKYESLPMSFADACLVRMTELEPACQLLTIDSHFRIYRRNGSESVPVIMPI
jgi:predicted nucleic acid-binding protein